MIELLQNLQQYDNISSPLACITPNGEFYVRVWRFFLGMATGNKGKNP